MADVEDPANLLPGLPACVVLHCILPRIPWHVRPLLKATCRAWSQALADPSLYSALTRNVSPSHGLLTIHQFPHQETSSPRQRWTPTALSIYDASEQLWRRLPPIPGLHGLWVPNDCGLACVSGTVLVIGGWDPRTGLASADVHTLDLAGGLWTWRKGRRMSRVRAFFHCRAVAQLVYVVGGVSPHCDDDGTEPPAPEAYDPARDEWMLLPNVVDVARYHHFNGLLGVDGNKPLAYGFRLSASGELERFWRAWDAKSLVWMDWDGELAGCGHDVALGYNEAGDGFVHMCHTADRDWVPLKGDQITARHVADCDRSDHNVLAVIDCVKSCAYAIIACPSRGHMHTHICHADGDGDAAGMGGWWQPIRNPGDDVFMCLELCYLTHEHDESL